MTTFYSDEMTNILAVPPVPLSPVQKHGKIRIAHVNYDQVANGSAGDIIQLCKLPAGRVRLLGKQSFLYVNLTGASQTVDIGWAAYTNLDATAVVADPDGLDDGLDVDAVGIFSIGAVAAVLAEGSNKLFESEEGVIITLTAVVAPAASDSIVGFIAYVSD